MRLGIRTKLVGTLLLAGLLPLAIALAVILIGVVELRLGSKGRMYRALAQERAAHLSSILTSQVELVELMNALPGTADLLRQANQIAPLTQNQIDAIEAAWPRLTEEQEPLATILGNPIARRWQAARVQESRFCEVMITDTSGRLVAASNKTSDYFQADEKWWQDCYAQGKGRTIISDVLLDESALSPQGRRGTLVADLCVPIYDTSRQVIGILKTSLDATWMLSQLKLLHGADELASSMWLVQDDGSAVPGGIKPAPVDKLPPRLAELMRNHDMGWDLEPQLAGLELVGFAKVEQSRLIEGADRRWHVVIAVARSQVLAPVYRLIWIIAALGLLVILVFFAGGLIIARREFIVPLRALAEGFTELKSGRRDFRLSEPGNAGSRFRHDEVGQLAQDFNIMAQQLHSNLQRLEEADAIKRQFIDLASHELRTPVTYILGAAQLAQRHNGNGGGEILSKIAAKATRLNRIVENMFKLLASDRFERGPRIVKVDFAALVRSVCQEHEPFLRERSQHWNLEIAPDLPPIKGDAEKLRDIVANLVSNAIRFSPDGGVVSVGASPANGAVELAVADSGPGISPDDLPHLFQPFFTGAGLRQSSGDYQYMSRGIGLGLSVVKRFVELHGGSVSVDTSSSGTTVKVRLPLDHAALAANTTTSS